MVLVLGGAGYIGSHMVRTLREAGESFLIFDNFENGHREAVLGMPVFEGDLREPADIRRVFREHPEIDCVMHFAAYISVGESVRNPAKYWMNNTAAVMSLLEIMREANVTKLVFSSTAAVYGEPQYVPIVEAHPKVPTSPYGQTKLAVEQILGSYDAAYAFRSVCLRYFNACGADPSGEIGEDHDPEEHLIPVAVAAARGTRPPLKVMGTDYDTPDGTCVRDYVHILDLAQAHLMALCHLRAGGDSRQYNLGSGRGFSVREVIDTVSQTIGIPVPAEDAPRRPGDPSTLVASSEKIRADWGWNPRYQDLAEIVLHVWAWTQSHPSGYAS